jgi:hypothetical protein
MITVISHSASTFVVNFNFLNNGLRNCANFSARDSHVPGEITRSTVQIREFVALSSNSFTGGTRGISGSSHTQFRSFSINAMGASVIFDWQFSRIGLSTYSSGSLGPRSRPLRTDVYIRHLRYLTWMHIKHLGHCYMWLMSFSSRRLSLRCLVFYHC